MSPIAHTGAALLGWQKTAHKKNLTTLFFFILIANFPDIDFLFFFVIGKKAFALHQYYTHNVFFVGVSTLLFLPLLKSRRERIGFTIVGFSHLLLDLLVIDAAAPFGFRLFYPLSNRLFYYGITPNPAKAGLADILTLQNIWVLVFETVVFIVPVLLYYRKAFTGYIQKREFRELT